MENAIRNFPNQLKFKPEIINKKNLARKKKFIVSGMGGSHLAADLLKSWKPCLDLTIHHNYGLPETPENLKKYLIIISSYSGNTEEALDGFKIALKKKLPVACISTGGELLELAKKYKKPYIQMPDTGIEPRSALGFGIVSFLKLLGENKALSEVKKTANVIDMSALEEKGRAITEKIKNRIPIIYTSDKNWPLAYNWKIRLNETGKIPSFCHTVPEVTHNEIVGFDGENRTRELIGNFHFIFLKEKDDHPRIILRMQIMKEFLEEKGLSVEFIELEGKNYWERILTSLSIADWAAFYIAEYYGLKASETEIINRLKKAMRERGGKL
ncbi:MAG: SIS domain-containing protein [bacterium]|nr:SIS domain-containing protein [bacterium]